MSHALPVTTTQQFQFGNAIVDFLTTGSIIGLVAKEFAL
jgi:hypothetical protein